jgi:hypothetical protein
MNVIKWEQAEPTVKDRVGILCPIIEIHRGSLDGQCYLQITKYNDKLDGRVKYLIETPETKDTYQDEQDIEDMKAVALSLMVSDIHAKIAEHKEDVRRLETLVKILVGAV